MGLSQYFLRCFDNPVLYMYDLLKCGHLCVAPCKMDVGFASTSGRDLSVVATEAMEREVESLLDVCLGVSVDCEPFFLLTIKVSL